MNWTIILPAVWFPCILHARGRIPVKCASNSIGGFALRYFPSAEEYQSVLERQGFAVDYIELVPRPTVLPTDVEGWISTFAHSFLETLPQERREEVSRQTASC